MSSRRAWTTLGALELAGSACAAALIVALRQPAASDRVAPRAPVEPTVSSAAASRAGDGVRLRGFLSDRQLAGADRETRAAALRLFRKSSGGPEPLRSGDSARAGDVVQLVYQSGGAAHGAIISHDGSGHVSLHWPPRVGAPTALGARARPLPYAFELDGAPRFERFLFVVAPSPLDVAALLSRAHTLGGSPDAKLGLPARARVVAELLINKR